MRRLNYKFEGYKSINFQFRYRSALEEFMQPLPPMADLRPLCPPIENQGNEGSCSGHAAAATVEFLQLKELRDGFQPDQDPQAYTSDFEPVSRHFIYYNEREIEQTVSIDAGATTLRDACNVLINRGVCRESVWPYSPDTLFEKPSAQAYDDAALHKVKIYYNLDNLYQIKHSIANGFPVMFGFRVYSNFMNEEFASTGIMPMPLKTDTLIGGHAVAAVGYDDDKKVLIVRNSWGVEWGDKGYFYMPYDFVESQYADDFYTLRLNPTVNP